MLNSIDLNIFLNLFLELFHGRNVACTSSVVSSHVTTR